MNKRQFGFGPESALSSRDARLARASTNRTSIWTTMPGCFLTTLTSTTGRCGDGGEIFSNEKTGMVYPLVVELRHSRTSSDMNERLAVQNRFRLSTAGLKD